MPTRRPSERAYDDLATRLGERVTVQRQVPPGVELCLGLVRDDLVGPLVLVAAGGALVEVIGQRRVALPPLDPTAAAAMVRGLPVSRLIYAPVAGPAGDPDAVVRAVLAMSQLAMELGDLINALDVNPLIVTPLIVTASPMTAIAVDALVEPSPSYR